VDAHTEARIADRLREARAGRTTIVVSASPLLLSRVDSVAFLHNGRIAAQGRHGELLDYHREYRALVSRDGDADPGTGLALDADPDARIGSATEDAVR
jgi:putative ABC transport system ATP-binding protein